MTTVNRLHRTSREDSSTSTSSTSSSTTTRIGEELQPDDLVGGQLAINLGG